MVVFVVDVLCFFSLLYCFRNADLLYMVSFFNSLLIALGFDLVRTLKLWVIGVFYANLGWFLFSVFGLFLFSDHKDPAMMLMLLLIWSLPIIVQELYEQNWMAYESDGFIQAVWHHSIAFFSVWLVTIQCTFLFHWVVFFTVLVIDAAALDHRLLRRFCCLKEHIPLIPFFWAHHCKTTYRLLCSNLLWPLMKDAVAFLIRFVLHNFQVMKLFLLLERVT